MITDNIEKVVEEEDEYFDSEIEPSVTLPIILNDKFASPINALKENLQNETSLKRAVFGLKSRKWKFSASHGFSKRRIPAAARTGRATPSDGHEVAGLRGLLLLGLLGGLQLDPGLSERFGKMVLH